MLVETRGLKARQKSLYIRRLQDKYDGAHPRLFDATRDGAGSNMIHGLLKLSRVRAMMQKFVALSCSVTSWSHKAPLSMSDGEK